MEVLLLCAWLLLLLHVVAGLAFVPRTMRLPRTVGRPRRHVQHTGPSGDEGGPGEDGEGHRGQDSLFARVVKLEAQQLADRRVFNSKLHSNQALFDSKLESTQALFGSQGELLAQRIISNVGEALKEQDERQKAVMKEQMERQQKDMAGLKAVMKEEKAELKAVMKEEKAELKAVMKEQMERQQKDMAGLKAVMKEQMERQQKDLDLRLAGFALLIAILVRPELFSTILQSSRTILKV